MDKKRFSFGNFLFNGLVAGIVAAFAFVIPGNWALIVFGALWCLFMYLLNKVSPLFEFDDPGPNM